MLNHDPRVMTLMKLAGTATWKTPPANTGCAFSVASENGR